MKNPVNYIFFRCTVSSLLLSLWLPGCGHDTSQTEQATAAPTPVHSLVFLDKSVSVHTEKDFVRQKYEKALADLIEQNIRGEGDRLSLYFVHENTTKAKALELRSTAHREEASAMNATDAEAAQTEFEVVLQKERQRFLQQALAQLALTNHQESRQTTDLWASLEVISKVAKADESTRVYYFSDMVESVKAVGRRDFHLHPPASAEEAERWAKADAPVLKKQIGPARLQTVQIAMVLPFEPTSSTKQNNPTVTHYWETLFELLGVEKALEEV